MLNFTILQSNIELFSLPLSYRSSNYCNSNICCPFSVLKAIAKSKGKLITFITITFKSERERGSDNYCNRDSWKRTIIISHLVGTKHIFADYKIKILALTEFKNNHFDKSTSFFIIKKSCLFKGKEKSSYILKYSYNLKNKSKTIEVKKVINIKDEIQIIFCFIKAKN